VSSEDKQSSGVQGDAEKLKQKFGPLADFYAETRAEAAETAGLEDDKSHWETVARTVEEGEGQ